MRVGYRIVFALTEAGALDEANEWFSKVDSKRDSTEYVLESANAAASLSWNANRLTEAMEIMSRAAKQIAEGARCERLHFLANYSVLASEAGDLHLAKELLARGSEEASQESDRIFWFTYGLFKGSQLLADGESSEAVRHFANLRSKVEEEVDRVGMCYALEWQGEALAQAGSSAQSNTAFRKLLTERRAIGCRTNPRTLARFARAQSQRA